MENSVTNIVHKLRTENNITQEHLAKLVSVTRQTIIAIERGNYTPSVALAIKISNHFNKNVDDVFKLKK